MFSFFAAGGGGEGEMGRGQGRFWVLVLLYAEAKIPNGNCWVKGHVHFNSPYCQNILKKCFTKLPPTEEYVFFY